MNLPHTPTGSASGWWPVDPPRWPVLFVNPRSGGGKAARRARRRGRGPARPDRHALDNPLAPGTRPALDTGRLGIVVLGVPGDTSLRPGQAWTAPCLEVSAPTAVHAGVDGEAVDLSPPLRFAIRPRTAGISPGA